MKPTKEILESLYVSQKKSTLEIAKQYSCNPETIRRYLIRSGIQRRDAVEYRRKFIISKINLEDLYIQKRKSCLEIAKEYGCSSESVLRALKRYNIFTRDPNDYHSWKSVGNAKIININPSPNLSYVLGVLLGDGWIYCNKNNYLIGLETESYEFCLNFFDSLKSIGFNPSFFMSHNKKYWSCVASSSHFFCWFKCLSKEEILKTACFFPESFVRGFYDSEGCFYLQKDKRYNLVYNEIFMSNTQKWLIDRVILILDEFEIHNCLSFRRPRLPGYLPQWCIGIYSQSEILKFLERIQPTIKNSPRTCNQKV